MDTMEKLRRVRILLTPPLAMPDDLTIADIASNRAQLLDTMDLRFDMSVLLVLGDQPTSDRSFRHCPFFGGRSGDLLHERGIDIRRRQCGGSVDGVDAPS